MKPKGKRLPPDTWETGDGRRVKIKEMTNDHLRNTLAYVELNPELYEGRPDQYVNMLEEARRRGLCNGKDQCCKLPNS